MSAGISCLAQVFQQRQRQCITNTTIIVIHIPMNTHIHCSGMSCKPTTYLRNNMIFMYLPPPSEMIIASAAACTTFHTDSRSSISRQTNINDVGEFSFRVWWTRINIEMINKSVQWVCRRRYYISSRTFEKNPVITWLNTWQLKWKL